MLNSQSRRKVIQNAKRAAKRDGYHQVVYACDDGSFSFCREANGEPICPLFPGERIIGRVLTSWSRGILQTKFVEENQCDTN